MFEKNTISSKQPLLWLVILAAALMPVCLALSGSKSPSPPARDSAVPADPRARAKATAMQAAVKSATAGFAPSLEMKENADFLLTPALLVQEAISENVIITYPSE
ncbi:MAG: hypothetical protein JSU94_06120 [Phycisphaerales bacterium]|nr:MAG: hypothetical protein JSU94_06120 [Phycisphaerales bacterium]